MVVRSAEDRYRPRVGLICDRTIRSGQLTRRRRLCGKQWQKRTACRAEVTLTNPSLSKIYRAYIDRLLVRQLGAWRQLDAGPERSSGFRVTSSLPSAMIFYANLLGHFS